MDRCFPSDFRPQFCDDVKSRNARLHPFFMMAIVNRGPSVSQNGFCATECGGTKGFNRVPENAHSILPLRSGFAKAFWVLNWPPRWLPWRLLMGSESRRLGCKRVRV
ncbi:hypothetical protein TRVL_09626 [Trypanosoma vivax]|nr:hypothetical protein TRVL_09626 [Trypanosoma vivax]